MSLFGTGLGIEEDRSITISVLEFDVLWEHLGLQDMPVVLRVASMGETNAERTRLVDAAWNSLANKGLGSRMDYDPRLTQMLRVIAHPDSEVDGRIWCQPHTRVLAATKDGAAVLVVFAGNLLTFRDAAITGLPREVLTQLPDLPPGPGESITLPSADFEAAARDATTPAQFRQNLIERGIREIDAASLTAMIGDLTGQGQFGVAFRDRWGARVRGEHVVNFFDTEQGRYVQLRKNSPNGMWSTISPVDSRRMHQHLSNLHDETSAAVARR